MTYVQSSKDGKNEYKHRIIAERALGRPLPPTAQVHHVDGDRRNNAHRNLVICQDRAYHKLLHFRERIVKAGGNPNTQRICARCKRMLELERFGRSTAALCGRQTACAECMNEYRRARKRALRPAA